MTDNDWKILARHGVTPDNLTVAGSLDVSDTPISALPDNLTVAKWLAVSRTPITALPDNLTVSGSLDLHGTAIKPLYVDERNYRLDRAGDHYHAGCRRFTAAEAIAHWGAPKYPDKARGAAFVAAVLAEENRRNAVKGS